MLNKRPDPASADNEDTLRQERDRIKQILDTVELVIVTLSPEGRISLINPAGCRLLGYSEEELIGENWFEKCLPQPEGMETVWPVFLEIMQGRLDTTEYYENEVLTRGGERRMIAWHNSISRDSEGQVDMALAAGQDITERKRTEAALKESEERYRSLFENMSQGVTYQDREGRITAANPAAQRILGLSPDNMLGRTVTDPLWTPVREDGSVFPVEDRPTVLARLTGQPVNDVIQGLHNPVDDSMHWVLTSAVPRFKDDGKSLLEVIATFTDITRLKKTEEELSNALQLVSAHFHNSPLAIIEFDPQFRIIRWSVEAEKMFGWTAGEVMGKAIGEFKWVYREDEELVRQESEGLNSGTRARSLNVNRNYRKDGTVIHCEWYDSAIYGPQGELVSILSLVLEITDRVNAEAALKESELLYRTLGEAIDFGVWICDAEGFNTYASESFLRMVGRSLEQIQEFGWLDRLPPEDVEPTKEHWLRCVRTGENFQREHRFRSATGEIKNVLAIGRPIRDEKGAIVKWVGLNLDITELKLAQEEVAGHRQLLSTLVNNLPNGALIIRGSDMRIQLFNPAYQAIAPGKEMLGKTFAELWPEVQPRLDEICRRVLETGEPYEAADELFEIRRSPGGPLETGYFTWRLVRIDLPGNEGPGLLNTVWETTPRKRIEDALRESEEKFSTVFRNNPLPMALGDIESSYCIDVNEAFVQVLGYSRADVIGKSGFGLRLFVDAARLDEILQKIATEGSARDQEAALRTKDGQTRYGLMSADVLTLHGQRKLLIVMHDITERLVAEKALKDLTEELDGFFSLSLDLFCIFSPSGNFRRINPTWEQQLGYGLNDLVGMRLLDMLHPDDRQPAAEALSSLAQGQRVYNIVNRFRHKDGSYRWLEWRSMPLGGKLIYAVARDVTERKLAEEDLARLQTAVEQAGDDVVVTDREARILYVNPSVARTTGYTKEELLGKNPRILKSGKHDIQFYREMWDTLTAGDAWNGRLFNRGKSGQEIIQDASITPIRDAKKEIVGYVSVRRDVTGQLEIENHLRQMQKMEAIGTLAGGIAHDFNNVLFAIQGNAELALANLDPDHPAARNANRVLAATQRAKGLVQQILAFSRKSDKQRTRLDLTEIAREVVTLMRASIPSTIEIQLRLDPVGSVVVADPTEMHQLLMNLCANAAQAMEGLTGILGISLGEVEIDGERPAGPRSLKPGLYQVLCVTDTGPGIPPVMQERIFEPFFTTKEVGRGTGLGLAVVHGIATRMGGTVTLFSDEGQGSAFHVYLPAEPGALEEVIPPERALPRGSERVLVVDDEPDLVAVVSMMIEGLGYTVETAGNGQEALELVKRDPMHFDAILTDQTMPKLTGGELAKEVLRLRPELPVLLCTGFSMTVPPETALEIGIVEYLTKPISTKELAFALRRALSGKSPVMAK